MASGEKVQVQVGNGFATVCSIVYHHSESFFGIPFLTGDLADLQHEMAKEFLVARVGQRYSRDWLLGNQEKVGWGLRGNVAKAKAEIVFVDDVGRDLPGDDFFKKSRSVAHGSRVSWSWR